MIHLLPLVALLGTPQANYEHLGLWDDYVGASVPAAAELYVSPSGSDIGAGTASDPFLTIGRALAQRVVIPLNQAMTINLDQGVYIQTEAIELPAFGVSLETWKGAGRAVIVGNGGHSVIWVNQAGLTDLPPTVIQGLEIKNGSAGVEINPLSPAPLERTAAVEIRDCLFLDNDVHVDVTVAPDWEARHVIEGNQLIGVCGAQSGGTSYGIFVQSYGFPTPTTPRIGVSSTLIRSNDIYGCEVGISVQNNGGQSYPRIFSNFVQQCESNIRLDSSYFHVVNNTSAFAQIWTTALQAYGLIVVSGGGVLENNIFWNPATGQGTPIDIQVPPYVAVSPSNLVENYGAPAPGFVGGSSSRSCEYVDLRLLPNSPAVNAGDTAQVWGAGTVALTYDPGPGVAPLRRDVGMDIDFQPRVAGGDVDQGADELADWHLLFDVQGTPSRQSNAMLPIGENQAGTNWLYRPSIHVTGPPGAPYILAVGIGFANEVLPDVENTALYQNFLNPIYGNVLIDLGTNNSIAFNTVYVLPSSGTDLVTLPVLQFPKRAVEGELYLQAFGPSASSNRLALELNEDG